jgi:hypothetical protein
MSAKGFTLPEGDYAVKSEIALEENMPASTFGSLISIQTIKSSSHAKSPSDFPHQQAGARFVDLPPSETTAINEKGFSFLKKPKKDKTQNGKHDSQFVQKIICNDSLANVLSTSEDSTYIFFNVGRVFAFADYGWKLEVS